MDTLAKQREQRDKQQRRLAAQMEKDAVLRSLETGDGGAGGVAATAAHRPVAVGCICAREDHGSDGHKHRD